MFFDRKNGFHLVAVAFLMVFSFLGLLCSTMIDRFFFKGNDADTPGLLLATQIFFLFIWCLTLIVIVPVQILYFRRKNRADASLPKATIKDALGLPFGVFEPDAKLPKWIAFPILAFFWLLVAVFITIVLLVLLAHFIHAVFPE